eukprot:6213787-Pleurochrysis_carterae.AAC.2
MASPSVTLTLAPSRCCATWAEFCSGIYSATTSMTCSRSTPTMAMNRFTSPSRPPSRTVGTSRTTVLCPTNVDITAKDGCVELSQAKYTDSLVDAYLPEGISTTFRTTHNPAAENLPALVESALASKQQRSVLEPDVYKPYRSFCWRYALLLHSDSSGHSLRGWHVIPGDF